VYKRQIPGFRLNNGVSINLLNGEIIVHSPDRKILNRTPIGDFIRRPRYVFNKLKEDMKV